LRLIKKQPLTLQGTKFSPREEKKNPRPLCGPPPRGGKNLPKGPSGLTKKEQNHFAGTVRFSNKRLTSGDKKNVEPIHRPQCNCGENQSEHPRSPKPEGTDPKRGKYRTLESKLPREGGGGPRGALGVRHGTPRRQAKGGWGVKALLWKRRERQKKHRELRLGL